MHRTLTAVKLCYALLMVVGCGSPEAVDNQSSRAINRGDVEDSAPSSRTSASRRKTSSKSQNSQAKIKVDDGGSSQSDLTRAEVNSAPTPNRGTPPPASSPAASVPTPPISTSTPSPDQAISDCHKGDEFTCKVEYEIVRLTNEKRSGMNPLQHDKNLAFVSRDWSRQQSQVGGISHTGFPAARAAVYQQEFGSGTQVNAENVAMFSGGGGSPEDVAKRFVDMWYGSPGHKANMLGPYQRLGAGVYRGSRGFYGTQIFGR